VYNFHESQDPDRVGPVTYRLQLSLELNNIRNTFHVPNLNECLSEETIDVPLRRSRSQRKT
jgi:hypothetical protein